MQEIIDNLGQYKESVFTHKSVSLDNYEKLEFLGDSILHSQVIQMIMEKFPNYTVGQLNQLKQDLCSNKNLSRIGIWLNLDKYIRINFEDWEIKNNKQDDVPTIRYKIRADVFEALVAAIFLTQGLSVLKPWIEEVFAESVENSINSPGFMHRSVIGIINKQVYASKGIYPKVEFNPSPKGKKSVIATLRIDNVIVSIAKGQNRNEAKLMAYQKLTEKGMFKSESIEVVSV